MSDGCRHCSLPIPRHLPANVSSEFCCAGCEAVYAALHASGLAQYYDLKARSGGHANRPAPKRSQAALDHEAFAAKHCEVLEDGRKRIEMRVDGITCGACLWLLEALPRLHRGVLAARVDLGRSAIALEWTPTTKLSEIAERLASLGYEVRPIGTRDTRHEWRRQDRAWLVDLAVAGAISVNVMAIAFALYGAEFAWMDDKSRQFFQWTSVGLALLSICWPGRIFLRNAWTALRARKPHMDLPIALALVAGVTGGIIMTAQNRSGVYLESITMLVFLLLMGRFVQFRQQRSARHEVELLCALVPQTARRVASDGALEDVPSEALEVGETIEVAPQDAVAADGMLLGGDAHFDMQLLTGESRPVRVRLGEVVSAGVRLLSEHPVRLTVTATGSRTRAAAIARMVESAMAGRTPVVEYANRVAGWFLLAVLVTAAVTATVWWFIDRNEMLPTVIALLVVTCPCALGLATPLTIVASIGKAAREGILIRGGETIERLAKRGTIVLDKTGTITEGAMHVLRSAGNPEAIRMAALVERHSAHPMAKAIVEHVSLGTVIDDATQIAESPGRGIAGRVDAHDLKIGNAMFAGGSSAASVEFLDAASQMVADGLSPVHIEVDGRLEAVVGVGDPLRPDAAASVKELREDGWEIWVVSGDLEAIAKQAAVALEIPASHTRGGCTPEMKAAIVAEMSAHPIIMVGDGVNDLPAMARADVGIAVRQGAQATIALADVALASGGLKHVCALVEGARQSMRTIHVNFAISVAYNLVGGVLAATGTITPLVAAILMPLSGLTVTLVALRMPRFGARQCVVVRGTATSTTSAGRLAWN